MNKNKPSVLIVGAGPTGLVLALWLIKLGVFVRIIDKNDKPGQTSRALIIQARTLEFYHQIGIADEVIAAGIKLEYFALRKDGKPIKTVNIGEFGVGISPYSFVLSFPQDDHEKLLLAHLQKLGVEIERETALIGLTQTANKVTAVIECRGEQESIEVDYLCGCDGARSTTREQLAINFPGSTYAQMFFVADVGSADEAMQGLQIGVSQQDFCLAFPVRSSKTLRLIGIVPPEHAQKEKITFTDVEKSVASNMDVNITGVNWFSTYHVHHRVVPKFSMGRVFLVGDAAHIHSPVGGQGMNTGIGDAINLAWKLAAVLQNKSAKKLLDTYEDERLPFAQTLVSTTDRVFQMVTSTSFLGFAWRQVIFPHLFPLVFKYKLFKQLFFKFISQIRINYRHSPLSMSNKGKIQAGDRLPWVSDGKVDNFNSLKSLAWQVHVYGTATLLLQTNLQKQGISLVEFSWSEEAKKKGLIQNAAYLIRPDGYISVIDLSTTGERIRNMMARQNFTL